MTWLFIFLIFYFTWNCKTITTFTFKVRRLLSVNRCQFRSRSMFGLCALPQLSRRCSYELFFVPYPILSNAVQKLKNFFWPCNGCPILQIIFQNCHIHRVQTCLTTVWTISSSQILTNVHCNRRNHGQTISPTKIFISMNLLQMPCVIT